MRSRCASQHESQSEQKSPVTAFMVVPPLQSFCHHFRHLDRRPSRADRIPARTTASERVAESPPISGAPSPRTAAANSSSSSTNVSLFAQGTSTDLVSPRLSSRKPPVQVVEGAGLLAVDVHQVVFGCRCVARVQRRERAVLVLQDQARDIGIVAGQHELRELPASPPRPARADTPARRCSGCRSAASRRPACRRPGSARTTGRSGRAGRG